MGGVYIPVFLPGRVSGWPGGLAGSFDSRRLCELEVRQGLGDFEECSQDQNKHAFVRQPFTTARSSFNSSWRRRTSMPNPTRSTRFTRFAPAITLKPFWALLNIGLFIIALALLSASTNGQDAPSAKPAAKPKVWKIAFDRAVLRRDYTGGGALRSEIYVMYSEGRGLRRMTNDGRSHDPVWSPNGSKLLFLHRKEHPPAEPYPVSLGRLGIDTDISILDSTGGEPPRGNIR